jgi:hypothetical protein
LGYAKPLCAATLLVLIAVLGCKSGQVAEKRKPVFPVRGKVLVQGKPAAGANVFFVPVDEPATPTDPRPRGEVREDGSFELGMYGAKDGAPAGEYLVIVLWEGEGGYDRLKGQYSDPTKSKLRVTVKEGTNELPPFQLN